MVGWVSGLDHLQGISSSGVIPKARRMLVCKLCRTPSRAAAEVLSILALLVQKYAVYLLCWYNTYVYV